MQTPHQGAERQFHAFARPNGDRALGITGPLVEIHERRAGRLVRLQLLSLPEAEQLHHELGEALRAPGLARQMAVAVAAEIGDPERPRAYTGPYPARGPSLAESGFLQERESA